MLYTPLSVALRLWDILISVQSRAYLRQVCNYVFIVETRSKGLAYKGLPNLTFLAIGTHKC